MVDDLSLEKSILLTLAYYDILGGYPLTAFEVYKYLIGYTQVLPFDELLSFLTDNQRLKKDVSHQNGFYFLKNRENPVKERVERQKVSDQKWKKLKKAVSWLRIIPFIKAAAVSGSLAINNARSESDWDLFIIAESGHIWTVRALLIALTQLMGQRRHGQIIQDKICLNWFIADQSLELGLKSVSQAQFISQLTPLWGKEEFDKFFSANQWTKQHLPFSVEKRNNLREIKQNVLICGLSGLLKPIFNLKIVEKKLKKWQKERIVKKNKPEYLSFTLNEMKKNTQAHLCLSDETLILQYPDSRDLQIHRLYARKIKEILSNCG